MIREGKKLPDNVLDKIPEVVRQVSQNKDVSALYSFGSASEKALKPMSDLDFGILLTAGMSKKKRSYKHLHLIGLFNDVFMTDEIDLVLMNDAPLRFSYHIIKDGKLLFCRKKSELINYKDHVVKVYIDFKYYRDSFDDVFLEGIGYDR